MAKSTKKLTKKDLQSVAYEELMQIIKDPKTSAAVKTQATTQLIKLADSLSEEEPEKTSSKLSEFLDE